MNYFQSDGAMTGVIAMPTLRAAPAIDDLSRLLTEGLARPVIEGIRKAAINLGDSLSAFGGLRQSGWARQPTSGWHGRPDADRHHDCCKGCGEPDLCHCRCCIVDADLVVYARLGERRVVSLSVENRWRRERRIKMELSGFATHGGQPSEVVGRLLPPASEFTLAPCGQQAVVLVLDAVPPNMKLDDERERQALPDVDDCKVVYADLRIEGCGVRPLRIAVALLPRDCGDYQVICDCGCC
jgi:hypothetical protein